MTARRGTSRFGCLVSLLLAVTVAYFGANVAEVYLRYFRFRDAMRQEIVDTLAHPRASSGQPAVIQLGRAPGSAWEYSGGGFLILQLLVEEVSGMSFGDYMQQAVFAPLGMTRSTYAFLGDQTNTAAPLTAEGEPAPFYRYAASGATGLATSAGSTGSTSCARFRCATASGKS